MDSATNRGLSPDNTPHTAEAGSVPNPASYLLAAVL
jgi:hypothetical protein